MALAFSRDGKVLATTSDDGSVERLGRADGEPARAVQRPCGRRPRRRSSARDGATLYTGSSDGSVIVWDVRGERRLGRPFRFDPVAAAGEGPHTPAQNASTAVAVSPDSSLFATSPGARTA